MTRKPFNYKLSEADEPKIRKELRAFTPICLIARKIGCCRQTLAKYIHEHMEADLEDSRESMLDMLEGTLYRTAVVDKNVGSLQFMLDRLGRHRGYGEHIVNEGTDRFEGMVRFGEIPESEMPPDAPNSGDETERREQDGQ